MHRMYEWEAWFRLMNDDAIMMNNETYQGHNHNKGSFLVTSGTSTPLAKFILYILNDKKS